MTPDRPLITVRPATADDMRFVKASWYESYRRGGYVPQDMGSDLYHAGHAKVIDDIIARPSVKVAVAVYTEIPDEICSWVSWERDTLHYLYTKQAYRHLHIAQDLVKLVHPEPLRWASHMTRGGERFGRLLRVRYNPYLQFHPAPAIKPTGKTAARPN